MKITEGKNIIFHLVLSLVVVGQAAGEEVGYSAWHVARAAQLDRAASAIVVSALRQCPERLALVRYVSGGGAVVSSEGDIANPVVCYQLLERLVHRLPAVIHSISTCTTLDLFFKLLTLRGDRYFPTKDDVDLAAMALVRLQDVYGLTCEQIQQGQILGHGSTSPLSVEDSIALSRQSMLNLKFSLARKWNRFSHGQVKDREVRLRLDKDLVQINLLEKLVRRLSQIDPHQFILNLAGSGAPLELYSHALAASEPEESSEFGRLNQRYKRLCREGGSQIKYRQKFRDNTEELNSDGDIPRCACCWRKRASLSFTWLKVELINPSPLILRFYNVTSESERRRIRELAETRLKNSQVTRSVGQNGRTSRGRVAKSCFLGEEYDVVEGLKVKVEELSGLSSQHAEQFQVVNYGLGGHYEVHGDFFNLYQRGLVTEDRDRIATVLFYLDEVTAGGATVFPAIDVAVEPIAGSAVLWFNLKRSGEADYRTIHASCPVLLGTKTIGNFWLHESGQEFRRRCSLHRHE